jgi:hypothetical protein
MARKPPRQNPVRDFVRESRKCGFVPVIVTTTLPDGTVRIEMRANDQKTEQEPNEWDDDL